MRKSDTNISDDRSNNEDPNASQHYIRGGVHQTGTSSRPRSKPDSGSGNYFRFAPPSVQSGSSTSSRSSKNGLGFRQDSTSGQQQSDTIPEPRISDVYIKYTDTEKEIRERQQNPTLKAKVGRRLKNLFSRSRTEEETSSQVNPYETLLPRTASDQLAVYGENRGKSIRGPVDWHQWYSDWDRVGQQYMGPEPELVYGQLYEQSTGETVPLHEIQLKSLKEMGFTFDKFLGKGAFGEVWKVKQNFIKTEFSGKITVNRELACKILSLKYYENLSVQDAMTKLLHEAQINENLIHPNIVHKAQVINLMDEKSGFPKPIHVLLFMELMSGDLFDLLHPANSDQATLKEFERSKIKSGWKDSPEIFTHNWVKQIVCGLRYLHEQNIAHLDIKPENILWVTHTRSGQTEYIFKLTDFGLSFQYEEGQMNKVFGRITTKKYSAPESLLQQPYDPKTADIYSLGVCIAHSIGGDDTKLEDVLIKIRNYDQNAERDLRISGSCAELIRSMIVCDSQQRPDIVWVQENDWLKSSFH